MPERFYADTHGDDQAIFVFDQKGERNGVIDSEHDGPYDTLSEARVRAKALNEMVSERAHLWKMLQDAGGRGVELAEKIDELDRLIMETTAERRLRIATEVYEEYESGGTGAGHTPEELTAYKYAVTIKDADSQGWVEGADADDDIARISLGVDLSEGDSAEWIVDIIILDSGLPYANRHASDHVVVFGDGIAMDLRAGVVRDLAAGLLELWDIEGGECAHGRGWDENCSVLGCAHDNVRGALALAHRITTKIKGKAE